MRIFIALDIPAEIRARLTEYMERARLLSPEARWARVEGLHVTLKFVGEVSDARVQEMKTALASVKAAPFAVVVQFETLIKLRYSRVNLSNFFLVFSMSSIMGSGGCLYQFMPLAPGFAVNRNTRWRSIRENGHGQGLYCTTIAISSSRMCWGDPINSLRQSSVYESPLSSCGISSDVMKLFVKTRVFMFARQMKHLNLRSVTLR